MKSQNWEKENGNYGAGFKDKGNEMSVIYTSGGVSTEKEMEIKVAELPKSVRDYVALSYKGAKIKKAAKISKSPGEIQYEAEVNGKNLLFTKDGKPVVDKK